ncbi:MAG: HelD family protein [Mycobacteriales bacterium]
MSTSAVDDATHHPDDTGPDEAPALATDPTAGRTSGPAAQGDATAREIALEQRYVDHVYERVAEMTEQAQLLAAEGRARGMITGAGVKWDDEARFFERDVLVHHASRRIARLDSEHGGLVFGRLDRRPDGDTPVRSAADLTVDYVGRIGVLDEEYEPLVIDWRAPAASVFYQATGADPKGVIRRRVLHSVVAKVNGVDDDLLDPQDAPGDLVVIGDGALMGALTRARGTTMRDIVATIQAEQDAAIRAPARSATLISGGPGTGKTVVALHRAAYLLYTDRRRFEGGGVLVIGPSPAFMAYIERVLPSLGEDSVTLRSIGAVVDGEHARRHDSAAVVAIKGSLRMRQVLRRAARDGVPGGPDSLRLWHGGEALRLDQRELATIRRRVLGSGGPRNAAVRRAARLLALALWDRSRARARADANDEDEERESFVSGLFDDSGFGEFVAAWWPTLTPRQVLGWLGIAERTRRYAAGVLDDGETAALAASYAAVEPGGAVEDPTVEDVALLDELRVMLTPRTEAYRPDPSTTRDPEEVTTASDREYAAPGALVRPGDHDDYAHLLVDEAQDLSPMQWRMVGRRGTSASWTVVGDPAQSAWPHPAESAEAMEAALRTQPRQRVHLATNYRNSAEIFDYAASLVRRTVPDADIPRAVRSTGHDPEHRVVADRADVADGVRSGVRDLLAAVPGTVAVLVADAGRGAAAGAVEGIEPGRVSVLSPLECKGMEYDGVLVVEPDRIVAESPMGDRLLYVALTRATQRLITLRSGPAAGG